jgi:hypothetical protein
MPPVPAARHVRQIILQLQVYMHALKMIQTLLLAKIHLQSVLAQQRVAIQHSLMAVVQ